jgi:hypothetical protein
MGATWREKLEHQYENGCMVYKHQSNMEKEWELQGKDECMGIKKRMMKRNESVIVRMDT